MLRFGSLRTRIIVFTTAPLIAILVTTLLSVRSTANDTVRDSVHKRLSEAGSICVQLLTTRKNELMSMAQVTARDPRFFATFSIPENERGQEFKPTLEGITADFLRITDADFIELFDARGRFIIRVGRSDDVASTGTDGRTGIDIALRGSAVTDIYESRVTTNTGGSTNRLVVAAVAPVYVAQQLEAIIRLGSYLDARFVNEVKRLTGTDVCLARFGKAFASTFPPDDTPWAAPQRPPAAVSGTAVTLSEAFNTVRADNEYLTIQIQVAGADPSEGFDTFVGRELSEALTPIIQLEKRIAFGAMLAVLVTLLVGFAIASSITKPLAEVVKASAALKEGQYDYPLEVSGSDEVAMLGRNFSEMRDSLANYVQRLKNIDQVKSNFIAMAGHELRTPLTIITGFNDMIASGALGEVSDKMRETTSVITEHLSILNEHVHSMLDLTYFEQGLQTLVLKNCDVRDLVRDVVDARVDAIEQRQLNLVVEYGEQEAIACVDVRRIGQAVTKILDNAIRFTPDDGTITVSVSASDERIFIDVEDTGVGIAPNELKWIFEKIYEVGDVMHHSSGKHTFGSKGFGLGLTLCKAIIDSHDGEIEVVSTPGHGSKFTIILARVVAPSVATVPASEPKGVLA